MHESYSISGALLTETADAIREKLGTSETIPTPEFPEKIRSIEGQDIPTPEPVVRAWPDITSWFWSHPEENTVYMVIDLRPVQPGLRSFQLRVGWRPNSHVQLDFGDIVDDEFVVLDNVYSSDKVTGSTTTLTINATTYDARDYVILRVTSSGGLSTCDFPSAGTNAATVEITGLMDVIEQRYSTTYRFCSQYLLIDSRVTRDTNSVSSLDYLYYGARNLREVHLEKYLEHNIQIGVASIFNMFYGCTNLEYVDLRPIATQWSGLGNISQLFYNCQRLISVDWNGGDTWYLSELNNLFYGCERLYKADLRPLSSAQFDVTNLIGMFSGCSNLTSVIWPESMITELEYLETDGLYNTTRALTKIDSWPRIPETATLRIQTYSGLTGTRAVIDFTTFSGAIIKLPASTNLNPIRMIFKPGEFILPEGNLSWSGYSFLPLDDWRAFFKALLPAENSVTISTAPDIKKMMLSAYPEELAAVTAKGYTIS